MSELAIGVLITVGFITSVFVTTCVVIILQELFK